MPGIDTNAEEQKNHLEVLKRQLEAKAALITKYKDVLSAGAKDPAR